MVTTKHSPEPWRAVKTILQWPWRIYCGEEDLDPLHDPMRAAVFPDREYPGTDEADARRIVACVNALAGIPTEALEAGKLEEALRLLQCAEAAGIMGRLSRETYDCLRALGRLP